MSHNTVELNSIINQLDLTFIKYWITKEYTFKKNYTWNIYQDNHVWGHKTHLNKFKRLEIIQSMFSDHNEIKLEINR